MSMLLFDFTCCKTSYFPLPMIMINIGNQLLFQDMCHYILYCTGDEKSQIGIKCCLIKMQKFWLHSGVKYHHPILIPDLAPNQVFGHNFYLIWALNLVFH